MLVLTVVAGECPPVDCAAVREGPRVPCGVGLDGEAAETGKVCVCVVGCAPPRVLDAPVERIGGAGPAEQDEPAEQEEPAEQDGSGEADAEMSAFPVRAPLARDRRDRRDIATRSASSQVSASMRRRW